MSNISTSDIPRVAVSTLLITTSVGRLGSSSCQQALCGEGNENLDPMDKYYWMCAYAPRYAEYLIESAIKNKTCMDDQFNVTWSPEGMTVLYPEERYPTVCTFSDQQCAMRVCDTRAVQRSRINTTDDGKWTCYSDSAIAQAAVTAKYWFATTNETWPCKGSTPDCEDLKGRSYADVLPEGAPGYSSGASMVSHNVLLLLVSVACTAPLGACGVAVI